MDSAPGIESTSFTTRMTACITSGWGEGGGLGWPVTTAMTTSGGDGEKGEEVMVIGAGSEGEGDISVEPILVIMANIA